MGSHLNFEILLTILARYLPLNSARVPAVRAAWISGTNGAIAINCLKSMYWCVLACTAHADYQRMIINNQFIRQIMSANCEILLHIFGVSREMVGDKHIQPQLTQMLQIVTGCGVLSDWWNNECPHL